MAGDLGVPTKESYSVDRSPLEIIGEGNKGAATKSGGIEWERMSTSRLYYPGQCYEVDGIAPLVGLEKRLLERQSRSAPSLGSRAHRRLSNVLDFRNARLLNLFVSDAGKILPRRRSRLSAKIHRKAVKHMKTSRVMGISAVTERLQELTKRKKKD
jgi:ribosomal protein S18|tara:strand:+ start:1126 stop:1593 length:468 start_codon:yes stop_codon:yes gene_type:complete